MWFKILQTNKSTSFPLRINKQRGLFPTGLESREKAPDWDALSDLKYEKRETKLGTEQGAWRTGRTAVILNRTSWRRQQNRGCQSRARGGRVGYALVSFLFLTQVCVLGSFSERYLRVTQRVLMLPPVKLGVRKRTERKAGGVAGRASPAVSLEGKRKCQVAAGK